MKIYQIILLHLEVLLFTTLAQESLLNPVSLSVSTYTTADCSGEPTSTAVLHSAEADGCAGSLYFVPTNPSVAVLLTFNGGCPLLNASQVTGFLQYPLNKCVISVVGTSYLKYKISITDFVPLGYAPEIAQLSGTGVATTLKYSNGNYDCDSEKIQMVSGSIYQGTGNECAASLVGQAGCIASRSTQTSTLKTCTNFPEFSTGDLNPLSITLSIRTYATSDCSDVPISDGPMFTAGADGCRSTALIVSTSASVATTLQYTGACPVADASQIIGYKSYPLGKCTKFGDAYIRYTASNQNFAPLGLSSTVAALSGSGLVISSESFTADSVCSGEPYEFAGSVANGTSSDCANILGNGGCSPENFIENYKGSTKRTCTTFPNFSTGKFTTLSLTLSIIAYSTSDCSGEPDSIGALYNVGEDGCLSSGLCFVGTSYNSATILTISGTTPPTSASQVVGFLQYPIGNCAIEEDNTGSSANGIRRYIQYSVTNNNFAPKNVDPSIASLSGTGVFRTSNYIFGNSNCVGSPRQIAAHKSASFQNCKTSVDTMGVCSIDSLPSVTLEMSHYDVCTTLPNFSTGLFNTLYFLVSGAPSTTTNIPTTTSQPTTTTVSTTADPNQILSVADIISNTDEKLNFSTTNLAIVILSSLVAIVISTLLFKKYCTKKESNINLSIRPQFETEIQIPVTAVTD